MEIFHYVLFIILCSPPKYFISHSC